MTNWRDWFRRGKIDHGPFTSEFDGQSFVGSTPDVVLLDLVEGRIAAGSWDDWWTENRGALEELLPPGLRQRLEVADRARASDLERLEAFQIVGEKILERWGVRFEADHSARDRARASKTAAIREKRPRSHRRPQGAEGVIRTIGTFSPGLANHLASGHLDSIGQPATADEIRALEEDLGTCLPADLTRFLSTTRALEVGGILSMRLDEIARLDFRRIPAERRPEAQGMIRLGEVWWQGDGDLLVWDGTDPGEYFYYAHETDPLGLQPIGRSLAEAFEWVATRDIW